MGNWNFLHIFYTPHFPHSAFSTPHIFHTPHFPHPSFSTLCIFHTPHSAFSTEPTTRIISARYKKDGQITSARTRLTWHAIRGESKSSHASQVVRFSNFKPSILLKGHGLFSKETEILRRWGSETQKFGQNIAAGRLQNWRLERLSVLQRKGIYSLWRRVTAVVKSFQPVFLFLGT